MKIGSASPRLRVRFKKPWFYDYKLPPDRDSALSRPPQYDSRGKNHGFETVDYCHDRNAIHIKVLRKGDARCSELADMLEACGRRRPCGSTACKVCVREFRRAITGQALPIVGHYQQHGLIPVRVTLIFTDDDIHLLTIPTISLQAVKQRLRMVMRRCHLGHIPMIGGIEIDKNNSTGYWDLHIHLIAFVKHEDELEPLRPDFQKIPTVSRPMHVSSKIRNLAAAIAYCWKFSPELKFKYKRDDKTITDKKQLDDTDFRDALLWLHDNDRPG